MKLRESGAKALRAFALLGGVASQKDGKVKVVKGEAIAAFAAIASIRESGETPNPKALRGLARTTIRAVLSGRVDIDSAMEGIDLLMQVDSFSTDHGRDLWSSQSQALFAQEADRADKVGTIK